MGDLHGERVLDSWASALAIARKAAVVVGGTSLSGGRGSVVGALLGALLLGIIRNAFVLLQLSPFFQTMSTGIVIVLAALLDQIRLPQRAR